MQHYRSKCARNRYVLLVWMFSVLYWTVLLGICPVIFSRFVRILSWVLDRTNPPGL